jgi:hypothetical protein
VWNKGIASLCGRRFPDEFPDGVNYVPISTLAGALSSGRFPEDLIQYPEQHSEIEEGELIWVRVSWLKSFVRQVLPLLRNKFLLVTGDSDSCIPSDVQEEARAIVSSNKLIHWFAQNYDGSGYQRQISPIPIGVDFHLQSEKPAWGEAITSPAEQEAVLLSLSQEAMPLADRIPKIYVDFAWQRSGIIKSFLSKASYRSRKLRGSHCDLNRLQIVKSLNQELLFRQAGPLPRSEMWQLRSKYAFVLSPHGIGLDCHRTWEALALGHIVLVCSSSLNDLYSGLPVIPITNWSDITPGMLQEWLDRYCCNSEAKLQYPKLKSRYWIDVMRSRYELCVLKS